MILRQKRKRANAERLARGFLEVMHFLQHLVILEGGSRGFLEKEFACRSQYGLAAGAVEEGKIQFSLELLDLFRERGLCDMKIFRGL